MRVLHIIPSISLKRGGPSKAILEMVKALRKLGIDAAILCTTDHSVYAEKERPIGRWFTHDSVPIMMFPCISFKMRMLREFLLSPSLALWLIKHINEYDLIHVHAIFSFPSTLSMVIARVNKVPYVVRTIGQLSPWSLSQSKIKKKLMLMLIESSNLKYAAAIHVTSNSEMEDAKRLNMNLKIQQIGLGVEFPDENLHQDFFKRQHENTKFVFLSRLHPKKRLDVILEAFSKLKDLHVNSWYLYVAGDGDLSYVQHLKKLARDYGLADKLRWMGHINTATKYDLLSRADWFILPSASENFGIAAVEAMASGVPVIITKEVGISDVVQTHKAGIICGNDALDLSRVLRQAMDGPSPSMRNAARLLVKQHYSWHRIAQELFDLYQSNSAYR